MPANIHKLLDLYSRDKRKIGAGDAHLKIFWALDMDFLFLFKEIADLAVPARISAPHWLMGDL